MVLFFQLLFTGLGIGSIYALVSLGFVLLIRAASVVNFAQGEFSMLGAYIMVIFANDLGVPYFLAIPIAIVLMAAFGVLFAGAVYWPLRHRGQLPVIISTIGASILLANFVLAAYGPSPQVLPGLFDNPGFDVGGVFMDSQYLAILVSRRCWCCCNTWCSRRRCSARSCRRPARTRRWRACSASRWR